MERKIMAIVDEIGGFSPRIAPVIRNVLATCAGNKDLHAAIHGLARILVYAKCLRPDCDQIFERELMRTLPALRVTPGLIEVILAAIDLDGSSIEDIDKCVSPSVVQRRKLRMIEGVKNGR